MEQNQNEIGQSLAITVEGAKQKMTISLTKVSLSLQALQNEADALVFNEDHVEEIKAYLDKTKSAKKEIEKTHETGKAPFWAACKAWDTAQKDLLKSVSDIDGPVVKKYAMLCEEIARKEREQKKKEAEKERIGKLIENTGLDFSQKIANCNTRAELNDVERLINLEKSPSRSSKYGEYHNNAIEHFDTLLIPVLKDQKKRVEEREELANQLSGANDPEKYDELSGKLAQKENEIIQNRVVVQENAMSAPIVETEATVILPSVKASRTDIVPEIVDMDIAFKKNRDLLNIELKVADAKKVGKKLQEDGAFGDKEEIIVEGIKYKIKRSW